MTQLKKLAVTSVVAVLSLTILTGCQGLGASTGATPTPTPAASPTETAAATVIGSPFLSLLTRNSLQAPTETGLWTMVGSARDAGRRSDPCPLADRRKRPDEEGCLLSMSGI